MIVVKLSKLRSDASFYSTMFSCVPHPISGKRNKADLFSSVSSDFSFSSIKIAIHSYSLVDSNISYFTFCELNSRKWRWRQKTLCIKRVLKETFDHRDILIPECPCGEMSLQLEKEYRILILYHLPCRCIRLLEDIYIYNPCCLQMSRGQRERQQPCPSGPEVSTEVERSS